jgi:hypothetical protein
MKRRTLAAAFTAALTIGGATTALAADLRDYNGPTNRSGAYDDPRYADIYGEPSPPREEPRYYNYGDRQYSERPPIPREPVYRDDYYRQAPPRYAEAHPYRPPHREACVSRHQLRSGLARDGWHEFHDADVVDQNTAVVKARRADGRVFVLKIDRCSGEIVHARPIGDGYGPFAGGPRRWERWN